MNECPTPVALELNHPEPDKELSNINSTPAGAVNGIARIDLLRELMQDIEKAFTSQLEGNLSLLHELSIEQ